MEPDKPKSPSVDIDILIFYDTESLNKNHQSHSNTKS